MKNTSKNEKESNQIADDWLISRVGVSQIEERRNCFLTEKSKQNPNPNGGAMAIYEDSRVMQDPWTRP